MQGTPAVIADGDAQGGQFCLWPDGLDPRNCATPDRPGTQPKGRSLVAPVLSRVLFVLADGIRLDSTIVNLLVTHDPPPTHTHTLTHTMHGAGLLMLREVGGGVEAPLGDVFWVSNTPPSVFKEAATANGVKSLHEMDAQTQV